MMDLAPLACAIASTPQLSSWTKDKGGRLGARLMPELDFVRLRRWPAVRHQFGYRVETPLPSCHEQNLVPAGIPENVIHIIGAIDFVKSGPTQIWAARDSSMQKQTQLGDLLRAMCPEILDQRRLFFNDHHMNFLLCR
jgi:hypothetical protein